ncbi:MAG: 2-isopropylmalate synthase [Sandaracinaceae bacterium]
MSGYVRIFDTTLRDGEQSPGATMTSTEKLEVARALARLRVDVIEAGFPAASPDDLEAVRAIATEIGTRHSPPIICALARAQTKDIDRAWDAIRRAERPRIHTFLATSDLHLQKKLRMTRDEVLARVAEAVAYARSLTRDVEFSPEDATRSDVGFLHDVIAAAVDAGATTINIPDTVGYATPREFHDLIAKIRAKLGAEITLSVHCHDDLGLATANALAGLEAGARQVEVTINGIGERAGNTALEELVMAVHTRSAALGLTTGIETPELVRASRTVSTITGFAVPPNKAVVGSNAFAHESGIHQHGMLRDESTYEIMRPETVGATPSRLVLGKHSGRAALAARLAELELASDDTTVDRVFSRFKLLCQQKKKITDADLEVLVADERRSAPDAFTLRDLHAGCGTMGMPTATIRLACPDGTVRVHACVGTGPVDAAFKAIDAIARLDVDLVEYAVHAVTEGIDALGHVSVRVREAYPWPVSTQEAARFGVYSGDGADTDIIVASAKAYVRAINRLVAAKARATDFAWHAPEEAADPHAGAPLAPVRELRPARPSDWLLES